METRTAPQWIRDKEKRYRRAGRMWGGGGCLGLLAEGGVLAFLWISRASPWAYLSLAFYAGLAALGFLRPEKRAERYETASLALKAAIARYEAEPDLPESALSEADQRAHEALRVERIRSAPDWIRSRRRRYRLRILGWVSPAMLALILPLAAVLFEWRRMRTWHVAPLAAVFILLLAGGMFKASKLSKAAGALSEAIERYEYESAATESALQEADQRASEALEGR
jgi:hypothetical protein